MSLLFLPSILLVIVLVLLLVIERRIEHEHDLPAERRDGCFDGMAEFARIEISVRLVETSLVCASESGRGEKSGAPRRFAHMIFGEVRGNRKKPRRKRAGIVVSRKILERFHNSLLGEIERGAMVQNEAEEELDERALERGDNQFEITLQSRERCPELIRPLHAVENPS